MTRIDPGHEGRVLQRGRRGEEDKASLSLMNARSDGSTLGAEMAMNASGVPTVTPAQHVGGPVHRGGQLICLPRRRG